MASFGVRFHHMSDNRIFLERESGREDFYRIAGTKEGFGQLQRGLSLFLEEAPSDHDSHIDFSNNGIEFRDGSGRGRDVYLTFRLEASLTAYDRRRDRASEARDYGVIAGFAVLAIFALVGVFATIRWIW